MSSARWRQRAEPESRLQPKSARLRRTLAWKPVKTSARVGAPASHRPFGWLAAISGGECLFALRIRPCALPRGALSPAGARAPHKVAPAHCRAPETLFAERPSEVAAELA